MDKQKVIVRPSAVLDTCFVGGWYDERNNPAYQSMFSDSTCAVKVEPQCTQEELDVDLTAPTKKWQLLFCDVLEAFEKDGYSTILRISAPAWPDCILRVYQYVTDDDSEHRFWIPELRYLEGGPGYIYGEAAMEYNSRLVLYGAIVPAQLAAKYLTMYMYKNEAALEAIKESLMIFCTIGHFTGLSIITDKIESKEIVDRVRHALEGKADIEAGSKFK